MACGCAYVSSDYGGVHEYTVNGRNVLLSLPRDVNGLVKNVSYLIENDIERINIAKAGVEDIKTLDWKNNIEKLEEIRESLQQQRKIHLVVSDGERTTFIGGGTFTVVDNNPYFVAKDANDFLYAMCEFVKNNGLREQYSLAGYDFYNDVYASEENRCNWQKLVDEI